MSIAVLPLTHSAPRLWSGRLLTAIAVLFLIFDVTIKVLATAPALEGTTALGFAPNLVVPIGIVELLCLILFLIPRTSVFGAVLLTGYLGGAVATHVRLGNPLFSHILFPIYVAVLIWGGLYLLDSRVRTAIGPRSA